MAKTKAKPSKPRIPPCIGPEARVFVVDPRGRTPNDPGRTFSLAEAARLDLANYPMVRGFVSYPHKHVYDGSWWSSTTKKHVHHESLLERDFLLWTDWKGDAVKVLPQPFAFLWPRGGKGKGRRSHVPDFALIKPDHTVTIVDVREERHHDEKAKEQFTLSEAASAKIGWLYQTWGGLPTATGPQLRFLAHYRQDRWASPAPRAQEALLFSFAEPIEFGRGLEAAILASGRVAPELLRSCAYHLLWTHKLVAEDLTRRLSDKMIVRTAQ